MILFCGLVCFNLWFCFLGFSVFLLVGVGFVVCVVAFWFVIGLFWLCDLLCFGCFVMCLWACCWLVVDVNTLIFWLLSVWLYYTCFVDIISVRDVVGTVYLLYLCGMCLGCYILMSCDLFCFYILFELNSFIVILMVIVCSYALRKVFVVSYLFVFTTIGSFMLVCCVCGLCDVFCYLSVIMCIVWIQDWFDVIVGVVCILFFVWVKLPVYPFYIWLPEVHVEATTEASVLLAGVLLKFTTFFMLRFFVGLLLDVVIYVLLDMVVFLLVGVVLAGFVMCMYIDIKKIIAYSSIFHVNVAVLCFLACDFVGCTGFLILGVSHGVVAGYLFFLIGFVYKQTGVRSLLFVSSTIFVVPLVTLLFFIYVLMNVGYPFFISFIGEYILFMCMVMLSNVALWVVVVISSVVFMVCLSLYCKLILCTMTQSKFLLLEMCLVIFIGNLLLFGSFVCLCFVV